MKSKKKKIWRLNGDSQTELVNDALSIIDAAYENQNSSSHNDDKKKKDKGKDKYKDKNKPLKEISDAIEDEPNLNPIAEALGKRLVEKEREIYGDETTKGTVNPLTDFLVKGEDDEDDEYDEQGENERVADVAAVVGEYVDGDTDIDEDVDTAEGDDDRYDPDYDELDESSSNEVRVIELYETLVPSRYILDDGITPVSFSVEYIETLDLRVTRESILNAIKMLTGNDSDDYVDDITTVVVPSIIQFIAFTRHPSAVYSASEMRDYFGSFKRLPGTEMFIANIDDMYFMPVYGPNTIPEMISAARGYAEYVKNKTDHYDESLGEYGYIAKWFITLARCAYTLSSMCSYEKPEYMRYLADNNIVTPSRDVVDRISKHPGTGRVPIQEIEEASDINNIESRFHVITDIEGYTNTMLDVIDVLTNSNNAFTLGIGNGFDQYEEEDDDEMSEEERTALDDAMDEMFSGVDDEDDEAEEATANTDDTNDNRKAVFGIGITSKPANYIEQYQEEPKHDTTTGNISPAPPTDAAPKSISPSEGATSDNGSLRIPVRHRSPEK